MGQLWPEQPSKRVQDPVGCSQAFSNEVWPAALGEGSPCQVCPFLGTLPQLYGILESSFKILLSYHSFIIPYVKILLFKSLCGPTLTVTMSYSLIILMGSIC